jgi:hypothetical protein
MGLPVTVYRWDDVGAPQIANGKPSEILNILKKCLVQGYSSKASLGWSISSEDAANVKIAFTNLGSGGSAVFYSDTGLDTSSTYTRVTSCQSFVGFNDMHLQGFVGSVRCPSTSCKWMLIGNGTAFYFMMFNNSATISSGDYRPMFFMGDFLSLFTNDAHKFTHVISSNSSAVNDNSSATYNSLAYTMAVQRSSQQVCKLGYVDGLTTMLPYSVTTVLGDSNGYSSNSQNPSEITILSKAFLTYTSLSVISSSQDVYGTQYVHSLVAPWFRGALPGLFSSPQGGFKGLPLPHIITINQQSHLVIHNDSNNATQSYLNLEAW